MQKSVGNQKIIWIFVYGILGLLAAVSIVQGCRNAVLYSQDFQWDAAKALVLRINPYTESLHPTGALEALGATEYFKQMEANQFPSLLLLLLPYTFLAPMTARMVWLGSNLVLTALVIVLLRKTFMKEMDVRWFGVLMLFMIAGTPWRNQIGVGQHTIFSFFFFLLAVWLSESKRPVLSGLSLTVCYFKYTLTVPLVVYFVYKKRWKELLLSIGIHIVLTIASAFWLGESFLNMIIQPLQVSSALSGEGSIDLSALLQGSPYALVLTAAVMILLLVIALRMPEGQDKLLMAIVLLWSLIITYHRTYDYFVMVLPFCYYMTDVIEWKSLFKKEKWELLVYAGLVFSVFFVLRIFSESMPSLIVIGTYYYIVTIWMTFRGIQAIRN